MPWPRDRIRFARSDTMVSAADLRWLRGRDFGQPFDADRLKPFLKLTGEGLGPLPVRGARQDPRTGSFAHPGLQAAYAAAREASESFVEAGDDREDARAAPSEGGVGLWPPSTRRVRGRSRAAVNAAAAALTEALDALVALSREVLAPDA